MSAKVLKPKKAKVATRRPAIARPCRIDIRLTKAEKAKLQVWAKKTRRTITSVLSELIQKL